VLLLLLLLLRVKLLLLLLLPQCFQPQQPAVQLLQAAAVVLHRLCQARARQQALLAGRPPEGVACVQVWRGACPWCAATLAAVCCAQAGHEAPPAARRLRRQQHAPYVSGSMAMYGPNAESAPRQRSSTSSSTSRLRWSSAGPSSPASCLRVCRRVWRAALGVCLV
jgi:hypothetical protein